MTLKKKFNQIVSIMGNPFANMFMTDRKRRQRSAAAMSSQYTPKTFKELVTEREQVLSGQYAGIPVFRGFDEGPQPVANNPEFTATLHPSIND